ncbi:hypothetical protein BSZ39_03455 [Bowdeniella nasicola]|uniref:HTH tetR-type domain-containing protein n=1 Tax=Bowdeniella nasicola TaxID=208480 RepID=A0A1Q5Q466_9ACTO|nr:hypothetical protein BSZ39_03455 [Bowdeniella nasicola]
MGLDPQQITMRALKLSEERGLTGWSIRELAAELDVATSVVYHYFPAKDDIYEAVVDHATTTVELPDESLDWKEWFTEVLMSLRAACLRVPGIAERTVTGKLTPAMVPIIEAAYARLKAAGFAEMTPWAYSMIFNVAMSAVAARDRQSPHHPDQYVIADMLEDMSDLTVSSPALSELSEHFIAGLTTADSERISNDYFRLLLASLLDGLSHVLLPAATTTVDRQT